MQTSETFLLNHLHRFCESQAFTNPRTLETFKKGEAENTDHGLKSENRWCHEAQCCMLTARAGGELGLQRARSCVPAGEASCLQGREDAGEDRAPIEFQFVACFCSHWGAGFGASCVRNPVSTLHERYWPFRGDLAPPSRLSPHILPARAFPTYIWLLYLEDGRQNPDSPFLALEKAGPAQ